MIDLPPWPALAGVTLLRILLAVVLLYVFLPIIIFPGRYEPGSDFLVQRAVWMAFTATAVVHILAVLRLYEAVMFLSLMALLASRWRLLAVKRKTLTQIGAGLAGWIFDLMDQRPVFRDWFDYLPRFFSQLRERSGRWRDRIWISLPWFNLFAVGAAAAWMLLADAFQNPSPALSDAPVTLAWMKYLENNHLYRDGVYPQGMYVFLTLIRKFTGVNHVEVMNLTGPLVGLLILSAVVYFVFKTTASLSAATAAALIYGTLPRLLPMAFDRHAAHNSQEFGLIFSLPAAWFAFSYLRRGNPADRLTASAAAGMTAFTHPIPALLAVSAIGASGLAAFFSRRAPEWRRLVSLTAGLAGAGLAAAAPMALALAAGHNWHGTSAEYLQSTVELKQRPDPLILGAVTLALIFTAGGLVLARTARQPFRQDLWARRSAAAAAAAVSIGLYLLPSIGVPLEALADRSGETAALGLTVLAALVWSILESALARIRPGLAPGLSAVLTSLLITVSWTLFPPEPVRPYRHYPQELIRQYLRADKSFTPGRWTLVTGDLGYALALGRAYHMYPDDFVAMASKMPPAADHWIEFANRSKMTISPTYLLITEKSPPQTPDRLQQWISQNHDRLPLVMVFNGNQLTVWRLELPDPLGR